LAVVAGSRVAIQKQVADVRSVAETLEPKGGGLARRRRQFAALQKRFARSEVPSEKQLGQQMARWSAGLFVGGLAGNVPWDNWDLERWFRLPKGHERRIHGHKHAGVRLVREGSTLLPALDAQGRHAGLFTIAELHPYRDCPVPVDQEQTRHRHRIMRRARSTKQRTRLLQDLERRDLDDS
jgi:hypothetical protein